MSDDEGAAPVPAKRKPRTPRLVGGNMTNRPRADFVCLSGKCDVHGKATTYELPINASRCPVCGTKRIKRLYNKIAVITKPATPGLPDQRHTSSSLAARVDQLAEPAMLQADASAARMKEARLKYPGAHMVSSKNLKAEIGRVMQAAGMHGAVPIQTDARDAETARKGSVLPGPVSEIGAQTQGQVPTKLEARDREFRVVRKAGGEVGMEKA